MPKTQTQFSSIDSIINENLIAPPVSVEQITNEYVADRNGSYDEGLFSMTKLFIKYYERHTFSFEDFLSNSAHLDLSLEKVSGFFNGWIEALKKKSKISETSSAQSCYSFSTFNFIK